MKFHTFASCVLFWFPVSSQGGTGFFLYLCTAAILDWGVPDRSQFIRSERLNASDISPDRASCRGFFLPLNHEESNRNRPP